ncbi:thiamine-phosphate kinase [Archaeoglobus neptunius]|uniref:thiamine-phosphate kinase n=1 Tax=Archaeoglobus neptunius TaxID=2798580 RepID=UPI0019290B4A|nr:thiamine-phosphate kinase [Archaeoglobus neptunius]
MKEFELLKIVERFFGGEDVVVPAGKHDAAYIEIGNSLIVLTCDTVNERSDFPPFMEPEEMGWMAIAVTLSDIAACGAKPLYFLSSISLKSPELFEAILKGIKSVAEKYGVRVVGGDIDFSEITTIAGFAIGEAERIITRKGAEPGDNVYVTDLPGKAQVCLELLEKGARREDLPYAEKLYTPEPRIAEGIRIAKYAGALTDVSDSLAISLHQIAESSGVRIILDSIDISHLELAQDPLETFLYGGGDFELLYTAKESKDGIRIGRVEEGSGVFAELEGETVRVEFRGYSHF